ncbi:uncharacterized protein [Salminus brasiliensis]|uniref:uncharacterized protein n=1 Tax=Salminus brasiliensis TaxID=930266 RepID=UPI003B82FB33
MTVRVGSSAVLPCEWRDVPRLSPHIEWRTISKTVFERRGEELYEGEGYAGRVDVPEDKLLEGNCSLVLKDVKSGDAGVYESYLLVKRTKRSLKSKRVFIQSVELSVDGCPAENRFEMLRVDVSGTTSAEAEDGKEKDESTHTHIPTKMNRNIFLQILLLWVTCANSPDSPRSVSTQVGYSVVLPCNWTKVSSMQSTNQEPHIKWNCNSKFVLERDSHFTIPGESYNGRVDVCEDSLRSGDCSLVLKNVKSTDEGVYESYIKENNWIPILRVHLTVKDDENLSRPQVESNIKCMKQDQQGGYRSTGDAGVNCPSLRDLAFSQLIYWLFQRIVYERSDPVP